MSHFTYLERDMDVKFLQYDEEKHLESVLTMPLRDADIDEIYASHGLPPEATLKESLRVSEYSWVIEYQGRIIAVCGVARGSETIGVPWFLATDELQKIRAQFLRCCFDFLVAMFGIYECLTNYVSSEHHESVRWLEWMGFTVDYSKPIYLEDPDVIFYQFYMWRAGNV